MKGEKSGRTEARLERIVDRVFSARDRNLSQLNPDPRVPKQSFVASFRPPRKGLGTGAEQRS